MTSVKVESKVKEADPKAKPQVEDDATTKNIQKVLKLFSSSLGN